MGELSAMTEQGGRSFQERKAMLRKMFRFSQGHVGTAAVCTECHRTFWSNKTDAREVWTMMLEILEHSDAHPSF